MIRKTASALLAVTMTLALPAFADGYMKLSEIKGETDVAKYKGWITVQSLTEGVDVPMANTGGTAARSDRVQLRPVVITKAFDSTTPQIRQAFATGRLIKDVVIEYGNLAMTLKNAQISSASSQSLDNEQVEEVLFVASEIVWATNAPAGGGKVEATYSVRS